MISNLRKFKHYDTYKLTEVGFCPSVKNQVESFTQAGKVLQGAQTRLYHFGENDELDDNMDGESIYNDKIDSLERAKELTEQYKAIEQDKARLVQEEANKARSHTSEEKNSLQNDKKDVE